MLNNVLANMSCMVIILVGSITTSFASLPHSPLTKDDITLLAKKSNLVNLITPEVINEINNIRANAQARTYMQNALIRMRHYEPIVATRLKENAMPKELLVLPLVESGYRPLDPHENLLSAAGIWQIIPSTAKSLGLTVNSKRDDRLNTALSTNAALAYLNNLHAKFNDWKLAVLAYEIGEQETQRLIKQTGSHEAWTLVRAAEVPGRMQQELRDYLTLFDASVIIMNNPSLVA